MTAPALYRFTRSTRLRDQDPAAAGPTLFAFGVMPAATGVGAQGEGLLREVFAGGARAGGGGGEGARSHCRRMGAAGIAGGQRGPRRQRRRPRGFTPRKPRAVVSATQTGMAPPEHSVSQGTSAMTIQDWFSTISGVATAIGVLLAAWQLRQAKRQDVTTFEDTLAKEYRDLAARLPTKALLGERLSEEEHQKSLDDFYRYVDLCNEQVFLHLRRRITKATWKFWSDGIKSNLRRPAFKRAWNEIAARGASDFSELRMLCPPEVMEQLPITGTAP